MTDGHGCEVPGYQSPHGYTLPDCNMPDPTVCTSATDCVYIGYNYMSAPTIGADNWVWIGQSPSIHWTRTGSGAARAASCSAPTRKHRTPTATASSTSTTACAFGAILARYWRVGRVSGAVLSKLIRRPMR